MCVDVAVMLEVLLHLPEYPEIYGYPASPKAKSIARERVQSIIVDPAVQKKTHNQAISSHTSNAQSQPEVPIADMCFCDGQTVDCPSNERKKNKKYKKTKESN